MVEKYTVTEISTAKELGEELLPALFINLLNGEL